MPDPTASKGRSRLSLVLRNAGDLISIDDVSSALAISRTEASKLLARWNAQDWVKRLRRGYYAPVPLGSVGQQQVLEDPWVMVPQLFGPACIGGWSAAEHWACAGRLYPQHLCAHRAQSAAKGANGPRPPVFVEAC